jgi:hypothetical protein
MEEMEVDEESLARPTEEEAADIMKKTQEALDKKLKGIFFFFFFPSFLRVHFFLRRSFCNRKNKTINKITTCFFPLYSSR